MLVSRLYLSKYAVCWFYMPNATAWYVNGTEVDSMIEPARQFRLGLHN